MNDDTELFAHNPLEALRSASRWAVMPSASAVRRRGRRGQLHARVLTGAGVAVLITSGAGVASAVGQAGGGATSPRTGGGVCDPG